ncbi:hypothetical protein [Streptomyces sp. NRRL S-920]|uniref:hypothetical protein n=1 Tax=Streptomyces sp. NRRL S-920 TaxID=1463921 RepID=UPI000B1C28CF|nr:hypothetical protein [Streptomyces sp. NRRL S-920]
MSENPQVDPRQGFGASHQGHQGPQGPGQAPPPMPGQAPPPVPPHAPNAPSAWSQPVPPGNPGGPGDSGPPGGRRAWLIGGAAALAVAVIVGVVVLSTGDDDKGDTAASKPPSAPGGAAKPKAPSVGKSFTKVPKGCQLIKASTIEKIAPGGNKCTPGLMDEKDLATMITRMPRWEPNDYGGPYQSLSVSLTVGASVKGQYDLKKKTALSDLNGLRKVEGSKPVSGLGEEAVVVSTIDAQDGSLAVSEVVVREGNAALAVDFTYSQESSDTTRKQAEDAAVAAARDVLASMS